MKGIIALSVVVLLAPAGPAAGQTREFRQSVPFQPGGELVFDTDKGSVTLTAWDRSEVAVYARIEGYASTCDAYHRVQMDPVGAEIVACIEGALRKSRRSREDSASCRLARKCSRDTASRGS